MSSQTSILDLPPEILEMIFKKIGATNDVRNCQIACEGYTDPRILKILSQIQFVNEGTFILQIYLLLLISWSFLAHQTPYYFSINFTKKYVKNLCNRIFPYRKICSYF